MNDFKPFIEKSIYKNEENEPYMEKLAESSMDLFESGIWEHFTYINHRTFKPNVSYHFIGNN